MNSEREKTNGRKRSHSSAPMVRSMARKFAPMVRSMARKFEAPPEQPNITSFMLHYPDAAMALRQPILRPVGGTGQGLQTNAAIGAAPAVTHLALPSPR